MTDLALYGSPTSPPSRAVYWLLLMKELPFEYIDVQIDQMGTSAILKADNPTGQVPTLRDGDFSLAEMPAILAYQCDKHGWDDFYPRDLQTRARVDQYLHFHHNFTRNLSWKLMGIHVVPVEMLDSLDHVPDEGLRALARNPDKLTKGQAAATEIASLIEQAYFPAGASFLCADHPTIADLACYEESIAVMQAHLFDFSDFPRIRTWMDEMSRLSRHEPAHCFNLTLGDIQSVPNTVERLVAAAAAGVAGLSECGVKISALERD